jgi:AcrR family transcriptional regulator
MYRKVDQEQPGGPVDTGTRPVRKADQRKASIEALMQVARHQFIAKGYLATSVEEIAAGAGLSKGAVYFYFKGKANLLQALINEAELLIVDPAVEAVAEAEGSATAQLVAFLHAQSLSGQRHAEWMMLLILMSVEMHGQGGETEEHLIAINDRMKATLTAIVKAGKREGSFTKAVRTKELVAVIFAVNQGCFLEWYRSGTALDGPVLVRALRATVLHGVLAQPE